MSKKILVISTTPRRNGNSYLLAQAFAEGAREAGHKVDFLDLREKSVGYCNGCQTCGKTHRCVLKDDMAGILRKMAAADAVAFATPVYFYEMCGQMKTLLDRTVPLYGAKYAFRDIYLLATSQDTSPRAMDAVQKGLKGWIACFDGARLAGVVRGTGADGAGDIAGKPAVARARRLGRGA